MQNFLKINSFNAGKVSATPGNKNSIAFVYVILKDVQYKSATQGTITKELLPGSKK